LKEINVSTIGLGVEHGNEEYRRKYLNRKMSNESLKKSFDIIHKYNIRTTANVIMGLPYETEEIFQDTIRLLRKLKPRSISVNFLQPYRGTKMREMAIEAGYIPEDYIITNTYKCLDMPQFKLEKIMHYYENLQRYVDGELELPLAS